MPLNFTSMAGMLIRWWSMVFCQVVHCPRMRWSSDSSACQIHTALVPTHATGHEAVLIGLASYLKNLQWFMQLVLHEMQT